LSIGTCRSISCINRQQQQHQQQQQHHHSSAASAAAAEDKKDQMSDGSIYRNTISSYLLPTTKRPIAHDVSGLRLDWMSGGVIAVIVLGGLCVVVGAVYAYIYFFRMNSRVMRSANCTHVLGGSSGAGASSSGKDTTQTTSTHLFLFKKS
jgi:hypothetical protein